ncbi:SDR family NAD(P)-dependent oxidoreductase [Sphingomonas sp. Mn802worker]|uniref:SDR family NAD(P)-dependent oxidoreductase n=1 Tax=Sphingomonas sp. Mn802worker TaxID=629773 RepID=UPI00036ED450|nr:glucose 1-dehydrogenase [Sphingomonas sp. Mn802worker]
MGVLDGRVALVTGAASGIGRATAQRFAREGARVWLVDRNADGLAQVRAELDGDHHVHQLDVTDEAGWITLAETLNSLDVLINNAGFGVFRSIADTTLEHWRSIMAVNLDSVFLATKYLLPVLTQSAHGGAIVNMSSIRGIAGAANTGSYCAAKGGVRMFTKAAALECAALGNNVRVNSIHPGHVATPLTAGAHVSEEDRRALLADTPIGRKATPEEIADAILFLASDASRYMTGAELVVDGGSTAQ